MKLSKLASAMPFAHLLGFEVAAARAEEDDDRKRLDGESDDDYAKRMEEKDKEDEARKAEEGKEKEDARKAAEEKDKGNAKQVDDDDEEGDAKADDEDDDETGKRAGRAKGARQRERVRCARIMAAGIKAGRVNQAGMFAFDTNLSASQAIAALNASGLDQAPAPRTSGLRERMSGVRLPIVGTDAGAAALDPNDPKAKAAAIVAAGKKRRGEA
ncbi:hypothetical protein [Paraburkholderia aromaticivorans]|uniref:Uncharacterized protein n=1 Tax=Paraburkholderia aromaticivorans TaxID=2026199 RepID=A0A248VMQ1_9BURK|nr:hypothetical protein [Paraburkholderia aromaticivorans]ASW00145.1 hypothetical protein CJU94_19515 [Paraburkholderia aromaticivorans]